MATVSVEKVAALLNLTPRRVQQLVDEGMPQVARGQYDALACMTWYIRFLQGKMQAREGEEGGGLNAEKLRKTKAEADMAEMERDERKGLLHAGPMVERELNKMLSAFRARCLAIPTKLAPVLALETDVAVVEERVRETVNEALLELADYDPDRFTPKG